MPQPSLFSLRARRVLIVVAALCAIPITASAYISQVDGAVLPVGPNMQACLDRNGAPGPVTGEGGAGILSAQADAMILPEAFRPVEDPVGSGRYPVTFRMIGEGAGYRNIFGWYYVDQDVTNPANLRMVFDCRPNAGVCACPCNPLAMRSSDGSATSWERTINFATQPGFSPGRAIGFFIRTPELIAGGNNNDQCGGPSAANNNHRTYFTSQALNDDGDFVHFLIYDSVTYDNTYYFGFEDLFRGGDNDFEDVLARVTGLVPTCTPQLETCNGRDDDCDLNVDEGLTQACTTACGNGVRTCAGGSFGACSAPTPSAEVCDNVDNNCNGTVDEGLSRSCTNECGSGSEICVAGAFVGCTAPTPRIETCEGTDQDCDGRIDEMITRSCATVCGSGTEMCSMGSFAGCTARVPGTETCNGTDDDCDGRTDENITRACSTICGAGNEVCIAGAFVGCTAPAPQLEACNNIDDDCDGTTDEGLTRTCSTACGLGNEVCMTGTWGGCDAPLPGEEICNNIDDDCDGVIDDGNPGGGAFCVPDGMGGFEVLAGPEPGERCMPGNVVCVSGELVCRGSTSPSPEICNCEDDDCDGEIDEDGDALCPGDGACVDCTCLTPCGDVEFPCPPGRECDADLARPELGISGYCVAGMCAGVVCPETDVCDPITGTCRNLCADVSCMPGRVCVRGGCVEDNCYGRGCATGERCFAGACEPNPCLDVTCEGDSYCSEGECVAVCRMTCEGGQTCVNNACVDAPCGGCATGESCVDNACVVNDCPMGCGPRRQCSGTLCIDTPCTFVRCPVGTLCRADGQCTDPSAMPTEDAVLGLATGGGGCACDAAGASPRSGTRGGLLGGLLLLLLLGLRRRRFDWARRIAVNAAVPLAVLAGSLLSSGCDVDPICLENCDGPDAGVVDSGRRDAMPADGCISTGEEFCDGLDNDCDGLFDEDFELQTDPRNCGTCERECVVPGAFPGCAEGECTINRCEIGFHDLDGNPTNGCEYECLETGDELCDSRDNDCDGNTDEGFNLTNDLGNCGLCGNVCAFNNANASCVASTCVMGDCRPGFVNTNGSDADGCELACTATGVETCNAADDDCDGRIDEGFDLATNASHCGRCGNRCTFVNATGVCTDSVCGIGSCAAGFVDVDGLATTGCEYACTPTGGADTCNGADDDCDGRFDEADPAVGTACGPSTGACTPGTRTCQLGAIVCVGGRGPTPETCDGSDEDCDSRTDEDVAGARLPGVGVRCGETNLGRCNYGSVVCTTGSLTCGGAYVAPIAETCNGIDDNCNGAIDDSPAPPAVTPPSCVLTAGVCAGRVRQCNGAAGWSCSFPSTYQTVETICDGLDNDCDGTRDEGCLVPRPTGGDTRIDVGDASGAANSVQPFIVSEGTNVYTAWMDLRGGGRARTYFSRSTDGGDAFSAPFRLDESSGAAIGPRIVSNGTTLNTLWADFRGGTSYREIMQRRSTNSGSSFAGAVRLNTGMNTDSFNIELAVSGSNVYAVYESFTSARNRHIFLLRSTDGGASFSGPVQLDHGDDVGMPNFVAATPAIAASGTDVHVVWRDNRAGAANVFHVRSTNSGVTFSATDRRLDTGTGASFSPVVAAEGSNAYVAWVDDRSGTSFNINFARTTDRGATFSAAVEIDDDPLPHDSIDPVIVSPSAGNVVVAWVDYRFGFSDIIVRRSNSAGASFNSAVRVDTGTAAGTSGSFEVSLAGSGSLVGLVWSDDRSGALDIYSNFSLDGGANWQPSDYRLDSGGVGTRDSSQPRATVSGTSVHAIWVDNRSGGPNGDIYYRRLGL